MRDNHSEKQTKRKQVYEQQKCSGSRLKKDKLKTDFTNIKYNIYQ